MLFDDEPIGGGSDESPSTLERAQEFWKDSVEAEKTPAAEIPPTKSSDAAAQPAAEGAAPEVKKDAQGAAPPEKKEEKQQTPEEKAAAELAAKTPPATVEEKAVLEHPKYLELKGTTDGQKAILDEIKPILQNDRYPIDSATSLKAVTEDAFVLYDIAAGKGKVADLLNLFEKNWKPENYKAVLLDLADYLKSKDIAVSGLDPRNEKDRAVIELQNRDRERESTATQERVERTRHQAVTTLQTSVKSLAEKNGVPAEDIHDYALVISAKLGADPKLVKLNEEGKAGSEIERLFTEHHNRELARQKRWLDGKVSAGEKREEKLPKVPARESGPAPKGSDKPYAKREELRTPEGRLNAAKREWDKGKVAS